MGRVLSSGILDIDGEKIPYTYSRGERLPNSSEWNNYIEAEYGSHISIDDHGGGLQYALNLLRNEIAIRKQNRKQP